MNKIVGRKKEIEYLQQIVKSEESEFVTVYGRRRVGKTFLIREFFSNNFTFYFSGSENANMKTQLENFKNALMITTFGVNHNTYWENVQAEVTMEDLFEF